MNQTNLARIICIYNQKGGAGKTTTACQLAGTMGHRGFDVLLADLDEQQTSASWLGRQGGVNFPATIWSGFRYESNVSTELGKLASKYDVIVVDCAPGVNQPGTWSTLLVCDLAIIPTRLNPSDTDALPSAKLLARKAMQISGREYPVRVLGAGYRKSRNDERKALELLKKDKDFPLFDNTLGDRTAFSRSMLYGATAHSLPNAKDAITELDSFTDEVLGYIGLPNTTGV